MKWFVFEVCRLNESLFYLYRYDIHPSGVFSDDASVGGGGGGGAREGVPFEWVHYKEYVSYSDWYYDDYYYFNLLNELYVTETC